MIAEANGLAGNAAAERAINDKLGKQNINGLEMHKIRLRNNHGNFLGRFLHATKNLFEHGNPKYDKYSTVDNREDFTLQQRANGKVMRARGNGESQLASLQQNDNIGSTSIDMQSKGAAQMIQEATQNCTARTTLTTKASLTKPV